MNPTSSSTSSSAAVGSLLNMLPQPRLISTTHTPSGASVFSSDSTLVPRTPFGPQATAFTVLDIRNSVPVHLLDGSSDTSQVVLPRCPPGGVIAAVSDIPTGFGSSAHAVPMHRTQSIDYAVVISGEIVLRLDSGEEKVVRAGEFIVQAGTNHTWANRSSGTCRILFVMVAAQKIVLGDGTVLEETAFESLPVKP